MSEQADTALFVCSDEDALFTDLYRRHHRRVRDFCRRRLSPDLVDDAVAEVFLTAWRRIADVPTGDEARLWLYGVAHRVVGHQWRTTARRRRLHDRLRSVESRPMAGADDGLADDDQLRLVVDAAAGLNPTDAEVLRLVAWEQLSAAQVAIVLGIAPNAVKQRLHRAKRNLAREYRRLESRQTSTPDAPKGGSR